MKDEAAVSALFKRATEIFAGQQHAHVAITCAIFSAIATARNANVDLDERRESFELLIKGMRANFEELIREEYKKKEMH